MGYVDSRRSLGWGALAVVRDCPGFSLDIASRKAASSSTARDVYVCRINSNVWTCAVLKRVAAALCSLLQCDGNANNDEQIVIASTLVLNVTDELS